MTAYLEKVTNTLKNITREVIKNLNMQPQIDKMVTEEFGVFESILTEISLDSG